MEGLQFDKSKWQKIKLAELADDVSKREEDPSKSKYKRFVGLEHFVSGEMKIKQWATTDNLVSAAKVFKTGDVLFARRNAYLRRASMVEFDGLCSGDAFVLRENHEKVIPGFLTFILNSEKLWVYANANAAGTMSKRVKWGDLGKYEFVLPPKDEQAKIANLLWASDEVIEFKTNLLGFLKILYNTCKEFTISKSNFKKVSLKEITAKVITYGIVQPGPIVQDGMSYIQSSDIKNGRICIKTLSKTSWDIANRYQRSEVSPGDIIFSLRGNIGDTAIIPNESVKCNLARGVARISLTNEYHNEYVNYALNTLPVKKMIAKISQGSTFKEISLEVLRKLELPIPVNINSQKRISDRISRIERLIELTKSESDKLKQIQKQLINQIFS